MNKLFVEARHLEMIKNIFEEYCPTCEVFAYGSRINGMAHEGSDLDLTVKNFPKNKYFFELKEKFSDSNIPFLVDINIYDTLPDSFKEEIEKNNVKIYPDDSSRFKLR